MSSSPKSGGSYSGWNPWSPEDTTIAVNGHRDNVNSAHTHEHTQCEPELPRDVYDQIVGQLPSELMSAPIILEAVVQQVEHTLEEEARQTTKCNEQLKTSDPHDLRWFARILNSAHSKRPQFVPEPKEVFKKKKLSEETRGQICSDLSQEEYAANANKRLSEIESPRKSFPVNYGMGLSGSEEEEYSGEEEEEATAGEDVAEKPIAAGDDDKKTKKSSKSEPNGCGEPVSNSKKCEKAHAGATVGLPGCVGKQEHRNGGTRPAAKSSNKTGCVDSKDEHTTLYPDLKHWKTADPLEWDSETVRNAALTADGFSFCVVLLIEDSPQLSRLGEFLLRAVQTGVRRRFHGISGTQIADRVKRFMTSRGQTVDNNNYMEQQGLFAEAIKLTLLEIKEQFADEVEEDYQLKELELTGARSKDLIRFVPPLAVPVQVAAEETRKSTAETSKSQPLPKTQGHQQSVGTEFMPAPVLGVKTRMRKRGEAPMPEFKIIDDSPPKGPLSYILLQGFYNPLLIDELRDIGVDVDGVLVLDDAKATRYSTTELNVEDKDSNPLPVAPRPSNNNGALPLYMKIVEKLSQNPDVRDSPVSQFWLKLPEMYKNIPADSPFYDIALIDFPLPESNRINLENVDGITCYIFKMFDEIAKLIYNLLVLEEYEFASAANVLKLQRLEPITRLDVYDQIVGHMPPERINVPVILKAVVQQVERTLEKESGDKCKPNDLRLFEYILTAAYAKRPKSMAEGDELQTERKPSQTTKGNIAVSSDSPNEKRPSEENTRLGAPVAEDMAQPAADTKEKGKSGKDKKKKQQGEEPTKKKTKKKK